MSVKSEWRDQFIAEGTRAGLRVGTLRTVLSLTRTLHRLAEASCNGDWPYANGGGGTAANGWKGREGADCPICGDNWAVESVKKSGCPDCRAQARVRKALEGSGWVPMFQGDPRGCVVNLIRAGEEDAFRAGTVRGIGVPA